MTNLWFFRSCDFLFFTKSITLKSFFRMIRDARNRQHFDFKRYNLNARKRYAKNMKHAPKSDPEWEPKSIQILQKTRFKNVLTFRIDFWRPLVPTLLAKWSPTRRTSSRKPNKKGKELEGNSRGQSSKPNTPAARGGTPGPERTFEYRPAL